MAKLLSKDWLKQQVEDKKRIDRLCGDGHDLSGETWVEDTSIGRLVMTECKRCGLTVCVKQIDNTSDAAVIVRD